jgi:translation initiation factor RLI1
VDDELIGYPKTMNQAMNFFIKLLGNKFRRKKETYSVKWMNTLRAGCDRGG